MGQYFYFHNATTGGVNQAPLPFNFGLPWVKGLDREYYSREEIKRMFLFVISANNWEATDEIYALGDYNDKIDFCDYQDEPLSDEEESADDDSAEDGKVEHDAQEAQEKEGDYIQQDLETNDTAK